LHLHWQIPYNLIVVKVYLPISASLRIHSLQKNCLTTTERPAPALSMVRSSEGLLLGNFSLDILSRFPAVFHFKRHRITKSVPSKNTDSTRHNKVIFPDFRRIWRVVCRNRFWTSSKRVFDAHSNSSPCGHLLYSYLPACCRL